MSKRILLVLLALALSIVMVACQPAAGDTDTTGDTGGETGDTGGDTGAATEEAGGEGEPFTIGISNGFVSSEWRTQMLADLEAANQEYMDQGVTTELVIESADTDVQGQTQQLQNLINRGVDAIIINPNSPDGLNAVIQEATDAGIVVIAIDQEITAPGAYNVVIDQTEWARISAEWLAEELGGEGDVVVIEGFVGHPANTARMNGMEEIFGENAGINVVGRDTGSWDQATGQQVMSDFLASVPNIDGVWTQDGMALGALNATVAANPDEWPIHVGEARAGYMHLWKELRDGDQPDFCSIGVVNPPGVAVSGLHVAIQLLMGKTFKDDVLGGATGNSVYVPIPGVVTCENFDEEYAKIADQPDSYVLDGMITPEEAAAYFND